MYINGYTTPPISELKQLIINNGGLFSYMYNRKIVTHVIANGASAAKVKEERYFLNQYQESTKELCHMYIQHG